MHRTAVVRRVPLRTGDAVTIRGERWRVAAESPFESVSIIDVDGCDATNRGTRTRFILPFERFDAVTSRSSAPRIVTRSRWRRAARATLADAVPHWASLRAAARAHLTILPFQLEPALALTRGDMCRVLIADEVGLGKTVQAGLAIAETIARTPDARVLIVSPAGLRDQWRGELQSRFELSAEILDTEGVARNAAQLVPDVNPWSIHPVAITSIDYVKRPEVMRSLEALTWDVVVFDEAHALAGRSDRAAAAAALARRARAVVLLTATPHSGDDEAFARLCALGDLEDAFPLTVFRRTRSDIGFPHGRRSILLRVRPTEDEAAVHRALEQYVRRLTEESAAGPSGSALVASILMRRACSSAFSLARSLERRKALLLENPATPLDQLTLPFIDEDSDEEPGNELGIPGLRDSSEEGLWLHRLIELARTASFRESKIHKLRRLIQRAREPMLVFTEYRDTLQHLSTALVDFAPLRLHGGLTTRERADVLRQFTAGRTGVLLATDAASEGLNLHHRCRLVVNLELPWTPQRLEQRIGRVDRLGQQRRVHAVQLVAMNTREESMGTRLDERAERIHVAFDSPGSINSALSNDARAEATRLLAAKSLSTTQERSISIDRPFVTFIKTHSGGTSRIWAFRLACVDGGGHVLFETVAGLRDQRDGFRIDKELDRIAAAHHEHVLATTSAAIGSWLDLTTRREEAIVRALRENHARLSAGLLQPGLFDRHAERAAAAQTSRVDEAVAKSRARLTTLHRSRRPGLDEPVVVFGVVFRP